jgi:two-component system response regulator GlrR
MSDRILLVDDDEQLSEILALVLESEGYRVDSCSTPVQALELLTQEAFSLVLLDLRLAEFDGLELLPKLKEVCPDIPVIMISAHGDLDSAVDAFRLGAANFIRKPFQEGTLKAQVAQAIGCYRVKNEIRAFSDLAPIEGVRGILKSHDPAMDTVLRKVAIAAQVTSSVVIHGESGTGKELVARALHQCGTRQKGPFIAFNCAAIPENLLESELFGYVRGAFTDARENKPGLFQRACGGTLFLDEIGDAPLSIQAKLLRVLQEREVLPLGATQPVAIDVRVVAATHKNLREEVATGRFRQDLYYRLHVLPIQVPPLRERRQDILYLASLFANRIAGEMGRSFEGFTAGAELAMSTHSWSGNVRELQNRVEHALAIGLGRNLTAQDLFPESAAAPESARSPEQPTPSDDIPTFGEAKICFEKNYLERILSAAKGNIAKAARLASKSRTEVYGLLRKHHLDPDRFKERS